MEYRVGIDLGGTNVAVGVVDENKQIIARASIKTRPERMLDDVIYDIGCCVKEAVKKKSENVIFAGYVEAAVDGDVICAIGDEARIEDAKDAFTEVKSVF